MVPICLRPVLLAKVLLLRSLFCPFDSGFCFQGFGVACFCVLAAYLGGLWERMRNNLVVFFLTRY